MNNEIHIRVARCSDCSLDADTGMFGYFLSVNNCNKATIDTPFSTPVDTHLCDVSIGNLKSRYECKQVSSISDCVDKLTYCDDLKRFCESNPPGTFTEIGDTDYYIQDGHILWNFQLEISKCGSARTKVLDDNGNPFPFDQQPTCLPYSEVHISNEVHDGEILKCPSGKTTSFEKVCNDTSCTPANFDNPDCCISTSNCESSVLGCDHLISKGFKICVDGDYSVPMCENPCASIIDIPTLEDGSKDELWQGDVCEFMCPSFEKQTFWFGGTQSSGPVSGSPNESLGSRVYKDRICSEEYFNLCRLAGCSIDQKCKDDWGRNYPSQYPTVYSS
jgi:hypothetical protein